MPRSQNRAACPRMGWAAIWRPVCGRRRLRTAAGPAARRGRSDERRTGLPGRGITRPARSNAKEGRGHPGGPILPRPARAAQKGAPPTSSGGSKGNKVGSLFAGRPVSCVSAVRCGTRRHSCRHSRVRANFFLPCTKHAWRIFATASTTSILASAPSSVGADVEPSCIGAFWMPTTPSSGPYSMSKLTLGIPTSQTPCRLVLLVTCATCRTDGHA